jgi:hypothetical protein
MDKLHGQAFYFYLICFLLPALMDKLHGKAASPDA